MDANAEIDTEATAWLVRRDRADWSVDDQRALEAWLTKDARHRGAFLAAEGAWRQADRLRELRPIDGALDVDILTAAVSDACSLRVRRRGWRRAPLAIATTFVGIAIVGALSLYLRGTSQTYATQVGGFERVVLPDGSAVALNTDTELRVQFNETRRRVRLIRGEASFKVARDTARAFEVEAGDSVFRAIGTAFSVRLGDDRAQVWVTEGRVEVATGVGTVGDSLTESASNAAADMRAVSHRATLAAGETAMATRSSGIVLDRVNAAELARRLAWERGELAFAGESLAEAVGEFNRYNREQIVIDAVELERLTVGGNFQATDVASFVAALERSFGIRAERVEGEGWRLSR